MFELIAINLVMKRQNVELSVVCPRQIRINYEVDTKVLVLLF